LQVSRDCVSFSKPLFSQVVATALPPELKRYPPTNKLREMHNEPHTHRLGSFMNLRAIIFVINLLNFVANFIRVRRIDTEIRATGFYPDHWNPTALMIEPFLLLAAAIGLLINRSWGSAVALLASGRVIYTLGYLPWTAVHYAHGVPMFSLEVFAKMWVAVYQPQPQYLLEIALATVIFIYSLMLLVRLAYFKPVLPVPGG
jgi:hypothetical protein